jgi:hypothetical protein
MVNQITNNQAEPWPLADFGYYMSLNICDIHLLLQQASKWQSVPLHLLESLQQAIHL